MKKVLKIILLCLVLFTIYLMINPLKINTERSYSLKNNSFLYLKKGDHFSEKFTCNVENMYAIALSFHLNSYKEGTCKINLKLKDGDKVIVDKDMYYHKLINDGHNYVYFDTIPNSLGKEFILDVSNTCDETLAMNFYDSKDTDFTYNGEKMNKALSFKIFGKRNTKMYGWYTITLSLMILLMLIMKNKGERINAKKSSK